MKTLILDGSNAGDPMANRLTAVLKHLLPEAEVIVLREQKIGNCAGDFFCFIRDPGLCNIDDDNRQIAAKIVQSDLLVYLTPITFGGYSSTLKRMVDHQVQNVQPFFSKVDGETHHAKRYAKYPDFLAIGWQEQADAQAEAIFTHLAWRNSLNFYARHSASGVVLSSQADSEIHFAVQGWLENIQKGSRIQVDKLPVNILFAPEVKATPIRHALLLVGSPRTRKSTSNSLGSYLFEHLAAQGVQTTTINIHTSVNSSARMQTLLEAVDDADLVFLAFPLYVDSLPAPVINVLEQIETHRKGQFSHKLFAAIANCGFPEAHHNDIALAICATFACQARFEWAGGLALGAGEGLIHGASLNELGGRVIPLKHALELAAEALARGEAIPLQAREIVEKPIIPGWMYLLMGAYGWKQQAKKFGADRKMKDQPYVSIYKQ
jgi:multimeric flavodoxin WrbA